MTEIRVQIVSIRKTMEGTSEMEIAVTNAGDLTFDEANRLRRDAVEFRLVPVDRMRRFGEEQ